MRCIHFLLAGVLALAALPAFAVDHTVTARNNPGGRHFDPSTLQISVGDTVTFVNDPADPGFHNVKSDTGAITVFRCANGCDGDGGNGAASSALWTATVTFPTAGTVAYHCEIHGDNGGVGMSGTITITGGTTTPSISVAPTSLSGTAAAGTSTTIPFTIANSGDAGLTWNADTADTDCAVPAAVPWIMLNPASGSVAVGDPPASVDVTLDATTLTEGVHNANICVHSNDAAHDPLTLPVAFTVSPSDLIFANGFDG